MDLFKYPTIELLWEHVFQKNKGRRLLTKISMQEIETEEAPALVCVPYGGGSSVIYKALADTLSQKILKPMIYTVSLPGHELGDNESQLNTFPNIAKQCVEEIVENINKPIILYGHSAGGVLAFEIARLLMQQNYPIKAVCIGALLPIKNTLFDSIKKRIFSMTTDQEIFKFYKALGGFNYLMEEKDLSFILRNLRHDGEEMKAYFLNYYPRLNLKEKIKSPLYCIFGDIDEGTRNYRRRYKEWQAYAEDVEFFTIEEAGHYFVSSHVEELAKIIHDICKKYTKSQHLS